MAATICIANQKGGSGKTSTAVNLACALAITKRRILLIDFDPQANATVALKFKRAASEKCLANVLMGKSKINVIEKYAEGNFDVICANDELTSFAVYLHEECHSNDQYLRNYIKTIAPLYDFIIIDCPPNSSILTASAMCASDYLLIPMPCQFFALDALPTTLAQYEDLNRIRHSSIKLIGVLRSLYDEEDLLNRKISDTLRENFNKLLLNTIIPFTPRISESTGLGCPVILYDKSSTGSRAYLILAGEILQRIEQIEHRVKTKGEETISNDKQDSVATMIAEPKPLEADGFTKEQLAALEEIRRLQENNELVDDEDEAKDE